MTAASTAPGPLVLGRYALYDEIAVGGMAIVHLGRSVGAAGFSRAVAIKRLQPAFARDPDFVSMFLDEARLAARVVHPNVVSTLDVVALEREIFLVLEYVHGDSLSALLRRSRDLGMHVPPGIATAVLCGALHGLHAAHEATSEDGAPLGIVHRDVSPQNLLVGVDGATRVLDFGIAKATVRSHATREGQIKGKLRYMAPEQLRGAEVSRATDVYAAGIVLWEVLTGDRPFSADNDAALFGQILEGQIAPPSKLLPTLPRTLDDVVLRALAREPSWRFSTAREMAIALEAALPPAGPAAVGEWVQHLSGDSLRRRERRVRAIEAGQPEPRRSVTEEHSVVTGSGPRTETNAAPLPARVAPSSPPPASSPTPVVGAMIASTRPPPLAGAPGSTVPAAPPTTPIAATRSARVAAPRAGVIVAAVVLGAAVVAAVRLAATPVVLGQARAGIGPAAALLSRLTAAAIPAAAVDLDEGSAPIEPLSPADSAAAQPVRGRPPSTRPECDPPYYVDDTGIRRVKRQCLR